MKKFVIGDIHGNFKALKQCLERSNFDYENDLLITLGDICDGYSQVYDCVEELLKIKNRIDIRGNHDDWFNEYLKTGIHPTEWQQGGYGTRQSYLKNVKKEHLDLEHEWGLVTALNPGDIPDSHKEFFKKQIGYFIYDNICFVHGGFDRDYPIDEQHYLTLCWDRYLWEKALSCKKDQLLKTFNTFSHIYIGHTHVDGWRNPNCLPITSGGVTNIDTGAGWSGKLTIMNIDTRDYFQSDFTEKLYPDELGRRKK